MAIKDKHHAFVFGILARVPQNELDGEKVIYAGDVPYEFRDELLPRWLLLHDDWTDWDSPRRVVRLDGRGSLAFTWQVWAAFVDWLTATLCGVLPDGGKASDSSERLAAHLADLRAAIAIEAAGPLPARYHPRSLKCGLDAGVPFADLMFTTCVYLRDVPLEFCAPMLGWLSSRYPSDPVDGSLNPAAFVADEAGRVALTGARWEEFIYWMRDTLAEALDGLENAGEQTGDGD